MATPPTTAQRISRSAKYSISSSSTRAKSIRAQAYLGGPWSAVGHPGRPVSRRALLAGRADLFDEPVDRLLELADIDGAGREGLAEGVELGLL